VQNDQQYAALLGAMIDCVSVLREKDDKTETLVTTLSQLVPGFEQAFDRNYAAFKRRRASQQANDDPRPLIADPLAEVVRELTEDR
jgi:hypothetical protein